jgi:hypothetical protein
MFGWYESSKICYAYLSDVQRADIAAQFPQSKWFTRGWTLQELLAPENVVFYDQDWKKFGTKHGHAEWISAITGIDKAALSDKLPSDLGSFCVAKRMSWASRQVTTRVEDTAYALLGIFNINMPLLYGEGMRAFTRLQEEILRKSSDDSILAWGLDTNAWHPQGLVPNTVIKDRLNHVKGVIALASSPKKFENCQDLVFVPQRKSALTMTSVGLEVELPLVKIEASRSLWAGFLSCSISSDDIVGIVLCSLDTPDDPPYRVKRTKFFDPATQQPCGAIIVGPRAIAQSVLRRVIIVGDDVIVSDEQFDPMRRAQICINESDALSRKGCRCTGGKALMTYGDNRESTDNAYWKHTAKMLSTNIAEGCQSLVSFRFELPHRNVYTHSMFTLFFHTEHQKAWVFWNDSLTVTRHDRLVDQMGSNSLKTNTDSLTLFDQTLKPFKLRITFEEKEMFRWRIFQINVDVKFDEGSDIPKRMHPLEFSRHSNVSMTTPSITGQASTRYHNIETNALNMPYIKNSTRQRELPPPRINLASAPVHSNTVAHSQDQDSSPKSQDRKQQTSHPPLSKQSKQTIQRSISRPKSKQHIIQ